MFSIDTKDIFVLAFSEEISALEQNVTSTLVKKYSQEQDRQKSTYKLIKETVPGRLEGLVVASVPELKNQRGLFCIQDFLPGQVICECLGQKIHGPVTNLNMDIYINAYSGPDDYLLPYVENEGQPNETHTLLDFTSKSSVIRFVNAEEKTPNARMIVYLEKVYCVALERIKAGEQIKISYGEGYFKKEEKDKKEKYINLESTLQSLFPGLNFSSEYAYDNMKTLISYLSEKGIKKLDMNTLISNELDGFYLNHESKKLILIHKNDPVEITYFKKTQNGKKEKEEKVFIAQVPMCLMLFSKNQKKAPENYVLCIRENIPKEHEIFVLDKTNSISNNIKPIQISCWSSPNTRFCCKKEAYISNRQISVKQVLASKSGFFNNNSSKDLIQLNYCQNEYIISFNNEGKEDEKLNALRYSKKMKTGEDSSKVVQHRTRLNIRPTFNFCP